MAEPSDQRGMYRDAQSITSGRHIDGLPAQRFGIQLPRARPETTSKTVRSRARSGLLQCRVGLPPDGVRLRSIHPVNHTNTMDLLKMTDIPCDKGRAIRQDNTGNQEIRPPNLAIGFRDP